jgi:hypothetical protein
LVIGVNQDLEAFVCGIEHYAGDLMVSGVDCFAPVSYQGLNQNSDGVWGEYLLQLIFRFSFCYQR